MLTSASASAIFDDTSRQPAAGSDSVLRQQQSTDNLCLADDGSLVFALAYSSKHFVCRMCKKIVKYVCEIIIIIIIA